MMPVVSGWDGGKGWLNITFNWILAFIKEGIDQIECEIGTTTYSVLKFRDRLDYINDIESNPIGDNICCVRLNL